MAELRGPTGEKNGYLLLLLFYNIFISRILSFFLSFLSAKNNFQCNETYAVHPLTQCCCAHLSSTFPKQPNSKCSRKINTVLLKCTVESELIVPNVI